MDRFARLIVGLLCWCPLLGWSASCPSSYWAAAQHGSVSSWSGPLSSNDLAARTAACKALNTAWQATSQFTTANGFYVSQCGYWQSGTWNLVGGTSVQVSVAKWFLAPSGQWQQTDPGTCTECPSAGTQVAPSGTVFEAGTGLGTALCLSGCGASAFMAAKQDGKNYVWGPVVSTGQACLSGSAPSTSTPATQCPVGQCPGTLNGNQICVPCSETKQETSSTSAETTASAASGASPGAGQTTSTSGTSSTTCSGANCTTTTTQTTVNPDGSSDTKTTTTTQPKSDYCTENPKAGACVGSESSWGGTCQAFTCDGDAVQCAQARGAWELACQLKTEATDPTVQAGTDAIARTGEAAIKDQLGMHTSQVFDLASRLDSTSLFGTPGACPSDTVLPLGIGSVTLPFASMCPQLNLVGIAMMGLAYLIAAFIVFRPGKGS